MLARHGRVSSPRARWPFPGVRYGLSRGCGPVSRFPPSRKSASGMAIWSSHLRTHHARLKRRLERETRGRSETRARIRDIDYTRSRFECITDRSPAQTPVAARFPRGALILFLASETENSFSTFAEGENAPQVGRSYPNAARDRPRCRRGGRGGRSHAQGARTECHGERGARDPPFFPLETENSSNNHW